MRKKKPVFEGRLKVKKGDEVIVLVGKDKGKRGKVIQTDPGMGRVIVDGVNVVTRHQKPRSAGSRAMVRQQLGEMKVPMGISVAKVMVVCPKCNKETRMGRAQTSSGEYVRSCRKCGEPLDG